MKWSNWLAKWGMSSLKIQAGFLEMEFNPNNCDKNAAWEMYIELLTRVATQPLEANYGDEKAALESVYSLFGSTRSVIKTHSRHCLEFTKIAIVILNQKIRPFTSKWHKRSILGDFEDSVACFEFREDLAKLQIDLIKYTAMLGDMAGVEEDLILLES